MRKSLKIRLALTFAVLNCLALSVNYFGISPKIEATTTHQTFEIFLLTDSEIGLRAQVPEVGYLDQKSKSLWPFESFYVNTSVSAENYTGKFRGFFAGFGFSEFIVYNSLLLGTLLFLKLW